ncbi:helix-turn-helix domain-containing protein [Serratia sp. L9]|uniref:helix-turn-helix domain-containing protein n=1 Tax=Serratia sp. L9 TaxID=3423946 RepID=UPI003D679A93
MPINTEQKLRQLRLAQGLTQKEFSELPGLKLGSVKNYESGHSTVGLMIVTTILRHERFRKYTLWVICDEARPDSGQIGLE